MVVMLWSHSIPLFPFPGQTYSLLKQFALYNFQLNETVLQFESPSHTVWPYMVVMSDSCVMCKRLSGEGVRWEILTCLIPVHWLSDTGSLAV